MNTHTKEPTLSRGDASALWLFVAAACAILVFTAVQGTIRIVELVRNTDVRVPAVFSGTAAEAPIGPDGSPLTVELDAAVLTVDSLPAASVAAGILEVLVTLVALALTILFVALLCRELLRGRIFSRRNTRIAAAAGITAVVGLVLAPFFGNMVANGAFAKLSDRTFDNVIMGFELHNLIFAAFIAAFVASVFAVGDRLQRETEGLV